MGISFSSAQPARRGPSRGFGQGEALSVLVLLVLAVLWGIVLIPPFLRSRADARPASSIGRFRHQLRVLERTAPGDPPPGYRRPTPAPSVRPSLVAVGGASVRVRRRRAVASGLLAAVGLTGLAAVAASGPVMLALHVAVDLTFLAYMALLVRTRRPAGGDRARLRVLPGSGPSPEPALLLRRAGS
jgi:hypothetical protein